MDKSVTARNKNANSLDESLHKYLKGCGILALFPNENENGLGDLVFRIPNLQVLQDEYPSLSKALSKLSEEEDIDEDAPRFGIMAFRADTPEKFEALLQVTETIEELNFEVLDEMAGDVTEQEVPSLEDEDFVRIVEALLLLTQG